MLFKCPSVSVCHCQQVEVICLLADLYLLFLIYVLVERIPFI